MKTRKKQIVEAVLNKLDRTKICADCGKEPSEGWPDAETDGEVCQSCWEAQCSKSWWEMYDRLGQAGLLNDE